MFPIYPYLNINDLNLDYLLRTVRLLEAEIKNFVNFNKIKYADPLAWNITTQYEGNTVVIDPATGIAYLSTQAVPNGVVITNTDYWTPIFDMSAFFADLGDVNDLLTSDKSSVVNAINEIFTKISNLPFTTPETFGAVGDGITDDTTAIQNALNAASIVVFSPKTYMINDSGLLLNSGNKLVLNDAKIKMLPTNNGSYDMFKIYNVDEVLIVGGTVDGSKETHIGSTGEQGHCIKIGGSNGVKVSNVTLINAWGDGLTAFTRNGEPAKNVTIENITIDGCRRNGLTIDGVIGYLANNINILNIGGTAPQAAVCIEPPNNNLIVDNIEFNNLNIEACVNGIEINMYDNTEPFNMIFNNVKIDGSGVSVHSGRAATHGNIVFNNPYIKPQYFGISIDKWDTEAGHIDIINPVIVVDFSGTDQWSTTPIMILNSVNEGATYIGNVTIENPQVVYLNGNTGTGYDIGINDAINDTYKAIYIKSNKTVKIARYDCISKIENSDPLIFENPAIFEYPKSYGDYVGTFTNKTGAGLTQVKLNKSKNLYKNMELEFIVQGNNGTDGIEIIPKDSTVNFPAAYPNGLFTRVTGSTVKLKFFNNVWQIVSITGTWTAL